MTGDTYDVDAEPGVPAEDGESWDATARRLRGCTVTKRERARTAAAVIRSHPQVLGVDTLAPTTGPRDAWTLECTLTSGTCPPAVLRTLASKRLHVLEACPRGSGYHVIARA